MEYLLNTSNAISGQKFQLKMHDRFKYNMWEVSYVTNYVIYLHAIFFKYKNEFLLMLKRILDVGSDCSDSRHKVLE